MLIITQWADVLPNINYGGSYEEYRAELTRDYGENIFRYAAIAVIVIGAGLLLYGVILLFKQNIKLTPRYCRRYVKKKDDPFFIERFAFGVMIAGAGVVLCGIGELTDEPFLWFGALLVLAGAILADSATQKYNTP